jgi:hypothetical protein
MSQPPTIGFDTSTINRLERDGIESEPLMVALKCGFHVCLPAMSADEVLSDPDPVRRERWLSRCQRLLAAGECLWPPHEILRLLVSEHFQNPPQFHWTRVNVRARIFELAIIRRDFTDELCAEQRREQFRMGNNFKKMWRELRPKLDEVLADEPSKRPGSYSEALAIAEAEGGILWTCFGQPLYRYVTGVTPSEAETKAFMDACPPFRAACYGLVMAWFDGALKIRQPDEPEPPGRNDLLMATYLPYCGRFVTDDWPQEKALSEVAAAAHIDSSVLSYEKFSEGFAVGVKTAGQAKGQFIAGQR